MSTDTLESLFWILSTTLASGAGIVLALEAKRGIRRENAEREKSWHAKPEALASAGLIPETASRAERLSDSAVITEAVKVHKAGLIKDGKMMCIVSDFKLEEVIGMLDLSTEALQMLGYRPLADEIHRAVLREFDTSYRLREKGVQ